jgi:ABC-2 type transport system ATP-binding protein
MALPDRPQPFPLLAEPSSSAPLLSLSQVNKRWSPELPPVLQALDLTLGAGELVAVAGRNGIGKTTLLRVISGLLVPDSGVLRLAGLDPEHDRTEYNRRLGLLTAGTSGLYARLDIDQNLGFWARQALIPRRRRREAIAEVIDRFALHEVRGRRVDRLSMGQRQRVRLALVFLHEPAVALLDEPSTSLDAEGIAIVREALARHRSGGGAAIVCSPDSEQVALGLNRTLEFSDGRLRGVA